MHFALVFPLAMFSSMTVKKIVVYVICVVFAGVSLFKCSSLVTRNYKVGVEDYHFDDSNTVYISFYNIVDNCNGLTSCEILENSLSMYKVRADTYQMIQKFEKIHIPRTGRAKLFYLEDQIIGISKFYKIWKFNKESGSVDSVVDVSKLGMDTLSIDHAEICGRDSFLLIPDPNNKRKISSFFTFSFSNFRIKELNPESTFSKQMYLTNVFCNMNWIIGLELDSMIIKYHALHLNSKIIDTGSVILPKDLDYGSVTIWGIAYKNNFGILARDWKDTTYFLPIEEKNDTLINIGEWVLSTQGLNFPKEKFLVSTSKDSITFTDKNKSTTVTYTRAGLEEER